MTNLTSVAQLAFERGIDHINAGDMDMACRKLAHAYWLAVTGGMKMSKDDADVLRARLNDALGQRDGAA